MLLKIYVNTRNFKKFNEKIMLPKAEINYGKMGKLLIERCVFLNTKENFNERIFGSNQGIFILETGAWCILFDFGGGIFKKVPL